MNPPPERIAADRPPPDDQPVVLFDGACGLCSRAVRFIMDRDPDGRFRFAANEAPAGRRLLEELGLRGVETETVVLVDRGRAFTRSAAALRIARAMKWPWPMLFALVVVPRPVRDLVYTWVARNRHRWFGRGEACSLPQTRQDDDIPGRIDDQK